MKILPDINYMSILARKHRLYNITDFEFAVIATMEEVLKIDPNALIDCEYLSRYMTSSVSEIDTALASLLEKGYLQYTPNLEIKTSLSSLYNKIVLDFYKEIQNEKQKIESLQTYKHQKVVEEIIKAKKNSLTPIELSKLAILFNKGIEDREILDAVSTIQESGTFSVKKLFSFFVKETVDPYLK